MSTITVYSFEDADGIEDTYTTQNYREARERAQHYRLRLIANEYEWSEALPLEDYTPGRTVEPSECEPFDNEWLCALCERPNGEEHDTHCPRYRVAEEVVIG